jgi:hypothetical protein
MSTKNSSQFGMVLITQVLVPRPFHPRPSQAVHHHRLHGGSQLDFKIAIKTISTLFGEGRRVRLRRCALIKQAIKLPILCISWTDYNTQNVRSKQPIFILIHRISSTVMIRAYQSISRPYTLIMLQGFMIVGVEIGSDTVLVT